MIFQAICQSMKLTNFFKYKSHLKSKTSLKQPQMYCITPFMSTKSNMTEQLIDEFFKNCLRFISSGKIEMTTGKSDNKL